jgi:large subunit ribosomal protein L30
LPDKKRKITLTRSLIGCSPKQVSTIKALGLRKIRQRVIHSDSRSLHGMLAVAGPFVRIEDVDTI